MYTKGKWEYTNDPTSKFHNDFTINVRNHQPLIARVFGIEANAKLIAAAPDLLAVCEAVANTAVLRALVEKAEAAIDAATD